MFKTKVFCVGWCTASCLFFLEQQLINCFGKIWVVLKRTFKWLTAVVLKRTDVLLGRCSTAAVVWRWLTAEEAEAGPVDADVLAVRRWWLEERWLLLVCPQVSICW